MKSYFQRKSRSIVQLCIAVALLLICGYALGQTTESPPLSRKYEKSQALSADYNIYWNIDPQKNELQMALSVRTLGWIGFGFSSFSTNGSPAPQIAMINADVIFGWVANNQTFIFDGYTSSYATPSLDTTLGGTNSVTLVKGEEWNGRTILEFNRPLTTGDRYDVAIEVNKTANVIYAFGTADGQTNGQIDSHGNNRGVASIVNFFEGKPETKFGNDTIVGNNGTVIDNSTVINNGTVPGGIPTNNNSTNNNGTVIGGGKQNNQTEPIPNPNPNNGTVPGNTTIPVVTNPGYNVTIPLNSTTIGNNTQTPAASKAKNEQNGATVINCSCRFIVGLPFVILGCVFLLF
ncbi:hypothetical protein ABK040_013397 [Willaertia magna]